MSSANCAVMSQTSGRVVVSLLQLNVSIEPLDPKTFGEIWGTLFKSIKNFKPTAELLKQISDEVTAFVKASTNQDIPVYVEK
jgi:hypothetical protein